MANATRVIAVGSAALVDGFRLAGVEVNSNAGADDLEGLLKTLLSGKGTALVLVEETLFDEPGPWLRRALSEGGRVVVVQIPSLTRPGEYQTDVDRLLGGLLGAQT